MAIELLVVQFWPEIILVISNQTHPARAFDFEITGMISEQIVHHSVQLPFSLSFNYEYLLYKMNIVNCFGYTGNLKQYTLFKNKIRIV